MTHSGGPIQRIRAKATPGTGELAPLDESLQLLISRPGEIMGVEVFNPDLVSKAYLKVYNASQTTGVTAGTTIPVQEFELLPNRLTMLRGFEHYDPEHCGTGIVLQCTLNRGADNTPPGTDCLGEIKYSQQAGGL